MAASSGEEREEGEDVGGPTRQWRSSGWRVGPGAGEEREERKGGRVGWCGGPSVGEGERVKDGPKSLGPLAG